MTLPSPMRRPSRTRGSRYGALLIDSMPPATAMSMSPVAIPCDASITAFRPEPHTLLMVSAATFSLSPPFNAAWRAGFCPTPAITTLPMMHSSTVAGSMPARRTASAMTCAPSCGAVNSLSAPRNLPLGRRTALTMTELRMWCSDFEAFDVVAEQHSQPLENHGFGSPDLARPFVARHLYDDAAVLPVE